MTTLLITGAQRPVAANLAVVLSRAFDVVAVENRGSIPQDRSTRLTGCQNTQVTTTGELVDLIHGIGPDAVIHCGSLASDAWSPLRLDPDVDSVEICAIAQATCHVDGHFSMLSTDAIFDRPQVFHDEASDSCSQDAPWIRSLESAALEWGGLVFRSHPLAWGTSPGSSFPENLYTALTEQTQLPINPTCYATPVLVDELAEGWVRAFDRRFRGLLHLGGMERVGQLGFARRLAVAMNEPSTLEKLLTVDSKPSEPRRESSLCSRQARDLLGWCPSTLADTISEFAEQRYNGRWDALGRSKDLPVAARAA